MTGRGIVVRFLVGTRCFDVLNNVQTHFRAHSVSCLMSTGPRFILRPRHIPDHAPPSSTEGENEKCNTRYAIVLTNINIHILKYQEYKTVKGWVHACFYCALILYMFMLPLCLFVCFWRKSPQRARASSFTSFVAHTQWRTRVGRTPLDEWSARRRDLYLTTHNTHNRKTSMPRWDSNPQSQQERGRRPTP